MEWVLQVIDECDDALAVLMHGWLGLVAELGALMMVALGVGAAVAGPALGAEPAVNTAAAVTANLAALLKLRSARGSPTRVES